VFTGLIQTIGMFQELGENEFQISYSPEVAAWMSPDLEIGDSVAVDGVCLTVTRILAEGFVAAVSPETLNRSTLGQRSDPTVVVNLETSLRVGSKLGGHFVTGHVDGMGYLAALVQTANAWEMSFTALDPRVSRYIVPKGSIAVNGVSLTVADCDATGSWFKVAVIPHTYEETNLRFLQAGDAVNLEGDVLGKYVEKFLRLNGNSQASPISEFESMGMAEVLTPDFLVEHGYL
jgi:riboflavin synthase